MSIPFSQRPRFSEVQVILSLVARRLGHGRQVVVVDPAQLMGEQIRHVVDDLVAAMNIWHVEDSLEIKAHIACWHRCVHPYRGYVLCSDHAGRTFLIDMRTWTYLAVTQACLVQIDGVNQAKTFVDALYTLRNGGEGKGEAGRPV